MLGVSWIHGGSQVAAQRPQGIGPNRWWAHRQTQLPTDITERKCLVTRHDYNIERSCGCRDLHHQCRMGAPDVTEMLSLSSSSTGRPMDSVAGTSWTYGGAATAVASPRSTQCVLLHWRRLLLLEIHRPLLLYAGESSPVHLIRKNAYSEREVNDLFGQLQRREPNCFIVKRLRVPLWQEALLLKAK